MTVAASMKPAAPTASESTATLAAAPRLQLVGIQYLRAVAAMMVAYFHTVEQVPAYEPIFKSYLLGGLNLPSGVDIFFVISGFIMLISNRNSTPLQFALRRIVRVVPLYWVLTAVLCVLALWRPELFRTTVVSLRYFVDSLLFIPYANPGHPGEMFPLLVPGWSLNFEMFFYGIFALCLFAPARARVALVGVALVALVALGWAGDPQRLGPVLLFYTDIRILEFWLGMLIAQRLLTRARVCSPGWAIAWLLGGFALLLTGFPGNLVTLNHQIENYGGNVIPAALIVLGMVGIEQHGWARAHRLLLWLGDASYSIYLSHIFSLGLARVAWARAGLDGGGLPHAAGFGGFALVVVIAGAWFVYTFVERPLLRLLQARFTPRRRAPIAPEAAHAEPTTGSPS